ncbi:MAG TPA: isoprenyl transferase [Verrucomicrobia bacterium]|nr:isoprenyl transferase [Verrucomicrobiales bacterium]HIL56010.1 isoprenyl transferase [Verrucomicrobiota bacterium]
MSTQKTLTPKHIAIIMDGNGRWAKSRGLQRWEGHQAGAESVKAVIEGCIEAKVEYLTLYAFSKENWNRPKTEVNALMKLLEQFLKKKSKELKENNVRLQAIGNLQDLSPGALKELKKSIKETQNNTALTLILALSYGAREEIIHGVKGILSDINDGKLDPSTIDTKIFSEYLYTAQTPDPDLLIRTSGEKRLSNFLLWQISYAELFISDELWPDFKKENLLEAIKDFSNRERRYGEL